MSSSLDGQTVLVTGGCGFIGCHLVHALAERGVRRIYVVDSLRYGKRENLSPIPPCAEIIEFTIGGDPVEELRSALEETDYVFHLAAEKHNQSKDRPVDVFRANIDGTYELFDLAATSGVKKTVFTSSLYAYGRMHEPAMCEDEVPNPGTIYGITKLSGEHVLHHVAGRSSMRGTVLRYFFVYGSKQFAGLGYKSVVMKNFERLLAGEPPVIFGDGLQALDYTYVDDLVDATIRALDPVADGMTLNVASGKPIAVRDLTQTMIDVAGSEIEPVFGDPDWTQGTCRAGDPKKIQSVLGWRATTPLVDGLRQTFEWIRSQR